MFVGFFLRRIVTVLLCGGAFWLGMKTDRALTPAVPAAGCPPSETAHDN